MSKITFVEFEQVMSCDLSKKSDPSIEIWFRVDGCVNYQDSWLGKMIDKNTKNDVFWFGLVADGSEAYDYDSFEAFINTKIFYGSRSLKEVWDAISIISLGGGTVDEMLEYFLER